MKWFRMPLFCWALYSTAWIQILATPIVAITLVLVILERFFGIGVFDPAKGEIVVDGDALGLRGDAAGEPNQATATAGAEVARD